MKVQLTESRVVHDNGRIIVQSDGDIVEVSEKEGLALIEKGRAIRVPEPKSSSKRKAKKTS